MEALWGGEAVEEAWAGVGLLNMVLSLICMSSGEAPVFLSLTSLKMLLFSSPDPHLETWPQVPVVDQKNFNNQPYEMF